MKRKHDLLQVPLVSCPAYDIETLTAAIDRVIQSLGWGSNLRGNLVLIKPNLISSRAQSLACTNSSVLAAMVRWLADQGARIRIGDSPAFGTTDSVMERQGITNALKGLPYETVRFATPVARTLSNGFSIEVAAEALENDYCLNLPKLKAHNQMFVTGAVKNIFGIVVGVRKALLHMQQGATHEDFSDILIRLPELLPPGLSIVDGVEVMHVSGPMDGEPLALGCVGGAMCPVTLDTALLSVLELDHNDSPLWRAAKKLNQPGSSVDELMYPILEPAYFQGAGFVAPGHLNPIRFNPLRLLTGAIRRIRLAMFP